jgi:hypothetical protein
MAQIQDEGTMLEVQLATLTGDEIAITKSAVRVIRLLTAIGTAIAIPVVILFALPVLSYALVAAVVAAPVLIGYLLVTSAPRGAPRQA